MVIGSTVHPGTEKLRAFAQGDLADEEAAVIEQHLADCPACCLALEDTAADSFVGRLRQARHLSEAFTEAPTVHAESADTPAPEGVPPELARHPRYRTIRLIGQGGMGAVYLAEHRRMKREVALKVINPKLLSHPGALARFQQEVRAAAQLAHPNIVAAYDADQAEGLHFLVMEHVEGQNLADYLEEKGPLPVAEACDAACQAALGLQHAHERGTVHRDVKPHNLMRASSGRVKLLDFGLARLAAGPEEAVDGEVATAPHLTGAGAVVGTADYIAPEQARDAHGADGRADVYSLGCTLYHLLAGRPPFPQGSNADKLGWHADDEPCPLRDLRPDVPEALAAVLGRMMAKLPEDRYQSSADVAGALALYTGGPRPKPAKVPEAWLALVALAVVVASVAAMAGVVRLSAGKDREIVIETDDPNIEVVVKGKRIVRIVDPKTDKVYRLDREDLTLSLTEGPEGLAVTLDEKQPIILKRNGERIAVVRLERKDGKRIATVPLERKPGVVPEKGTRRLFNGKDLTGWVVDGGSPRAWRVEDGGLVGTGTGWTTSGFLLTERSYSDFHLRLEFQLSEGANSGVALRAVLGDRTPGWSAVPPHLEVQILDDPKFRKPDGKFDSPTGSLFWSTAANSYLRPDRVADLKPLGRWNEMVVESRGPSLEVRVNGRRVLNADLDKLANRANGRPGLRRSSGRIGLQQHTGQVRFRNIEIKELPSPKKLAAKRSERFFNGKDLTGWKGLPGYWRVEDGAIVGACPPGRPAHTFLVSKKAYKNFDLKFQVRRKGGGGNSGVQFRSRITDHRTCAVVGPQCEIDSASHPFPPGSLLTEPDLKPLAVKAPRDAVAALYKDAGFNEFHIRCVGKHVTIKVNGVIAIDDDYPDLPDEGVIAWQIHGYRVPREVTFRNIEFTDLGEGLKCLLNSKNLTGWAVEGDERRFRVDRGVLTATSPHWMSRGYLLRGEQYENYRLRFECQLEKGANSGVVVRGHKGERGGFDPPGAIDHPVIKFADASAHPNHSPGSTHWVASGSHDGPRPRDIDFPIGEWNAVEIEVRGTTCRVWVNNALVVSLKLDEANKSGKLLAGLARKKGHIGFQANVGTARYRNIEITELPPSE